jgi:hypothetical protein
VRQWFFCIILIIFQFLEKDSNVTGLDGLHVTPHNSPNEQNYELKNK